MSAPGGAPSPGPRSGSMGPGNPNGNGVNMPSQGSLPGTPVHSAPTPGPSAPPSGAMSQQNLNQIVSNACYPVACCVKGPGFLFFLSFIECIVAFAAVPPIPSVWTLSCCSDFIRGGSPIGSALDLNSGNSISVCSRGDGGSR